LAKLRCNEISLIILGLVVVLALPMIMTKAGLHPEGKEFNFNNKKALIIATNHGVLNKPKETIGKPTGLFLSELSIPYFEFKDANIDVTIASINGGLIPVEPTPWFIETKEDRIFNESKITNAYNSGSLIGAICHGVLGLINATDENGNLLIRGRKMTGVTNKQLKELGIYFTPMHPEEELRKAGVIFKSETKFKDIFANLVTVDDEKRFITGQNQNAGLMLIYIFLLGAPTLI